MLLANSALIDSSLYATLAVTMATTVYVCITTPYLEKLNNVRLIIHRVLVNLLVVGYLLSKSKLNNDTNLEDHILNLAFMMLVLLILDWLINFPYIAWSLILWLKRPGIVDIRLYVQQKGTDKRPEVM